MNILLRSHFYRHIIQSWILTIALFVWAMVATIFAFQNRRETLVVSVSRGGFVEVVTKENQEIKKAEMKAFLNEFIESYYTYSEQTYESRMGRASDLMSEDLWQNQKPKVLELKTRLKSEPLSQISEIESLDLLENGKVEAVTNIQIKQRLTERNIKLRANLEFREKDRSKNHPGQFEVTELSDVVL